MNKKVLFLSLALQAIGVLGIAVVSLGLLQYDLRVPLNYAGDALVFLMFIKGMILNGWTWIIPQLSAPYEMSAAAFPVMTNFDWLITKVLTLFTAEPGTVLNLFWLVTLVLTAWSATVALLALKVQLTTALVGGVLYAFLPFALLRNVAHLNLVYYLVPFLTLLAIHIASGLHVIEGPWVRRVTYLACVAQGFSYIYYSFFAVALFAFAAVFAYVNNRSKGAVKVGILASGLIIVATSINLSPSFYSWQKHGKPPEMGYKHLAEAEIYGAKIRRMVLPHANNVVPVFSWWAQQDAEARFPNENENVTARLGIVGTLGFVLLLLVSVRLVKSSVAGNAQATTMRLLAALSLFTLLVVTVGGLGTLFNLVVTADIRAYNRFSVFLSFFALAAVCLVVQRYIASSYKCSSWKIIVPLAFLACFSLYDQMLDGYAIRNSRDGDAKQYAFDKQVVDQLARLYPNRVSILQLPLTGFPPLSIHERMTSYDHLRPFLFSRGDIHWSWPSFSQRHRAWQDRISKLNPSALVGAAIYSGFGAIWIDRYGYRDDASALIKALQAAGAVIVLANERYTVVDLREAEETLRSSHTPEEFNRNVEAWRSTHIVLVWDGFYAEETTPDGALFRWSRDESEIIFTNFSNETMFVSIEFDVGSQAPGKIVASIDEGNECELQSGTSQAHCSLSYWVEAGAAVALKFRADVPKVTAPNDPRNMYFYILNPKITTASSE